LDLVTDIFSKGCHNLIKLIMTKSIAFVGTFLCLLAGQVSANTDAKDWSWFKESGLNTTSSTNTYAQAVNYGQTHPTRDGGSWSGW
jgi:hypothetical protein